MSLFITSFLPYVLEISSPSVSWLSAPAICLVDIVTIMVLSFVLLKTSHSHSGLDLRSPLFRLTGSRNTYWRCSSLWPTLSGSCTINFDPQESLLPPCHRPLVTMDLRPSLLLVVHSLDDLFDTGLPSEFVVQHPLSTNFQISSRTFIISSSGSGRCAFQIFFNYF